MVVGSGGDRLVCSVRVVVSSVVLLCGVLGGVCFVLLWGDLLGEVGSALGSRRLAFPMIPVQFGELQRHVWFCVGTSWAK